MSRVHYLNRKDSTPGEARGSDGRVDTSARIDGRRYYNSRDKGETFTLIFSDANCTVGDFSVYLKNTKTDGKHMVISSASINGDTASAFEFNKVSGTPGGGNVVATPFNMNPAGFTNTANVLANTVVDSDASPITGLSSDAIIDNINVVAGGHEEFRFLDSLRIGPDQAIGIRNKIGTGVSCFGVIFFYFE